MLRYKVQIIRLYEWVCQVNQKEEAYYFFQIFVWSENQGFFVYLELYYSNTIATTVEYQVRYHHCLYFSHTFEPHFIAHDLLFHCLP